MCHLNAYGVPQNRAEALRLFRMAAEAGHPEAINNIGGFYRDGIVVRANPETAAKWFARSAELGNSYGMLNYALALQRGEAGPRAAGLPGHLVAEPPPVHQGPQLPLGPPGPVEKRLCRHVPPPLSILYNSLNNWII